MNRHLLPDEIDLLLDGEEGFGVAPLRTHLDGCSDCRKRFDSLAIVVTQLESVTHHLPAPRFADRVMKQVQVFEPWHVSIWDTLGRFWPKSPTARLAVGTVAGVMGITASVAAVWIGRRADAVLFLANLVAEKTRAGVVGAASQSVQALFGTEAAQSLAQGNALALAGVVGAGVIAVGVVALGLKAVTAAGRRRG